MSDVVKESSEDDVVSLFSFLGVFAGLLSVLKLAHLFACWTFESTGCIEYAKMGFLHFNWFSFNIQWRLVNVIILGQTELAVRHKKRHKN
jgi:hypothetical protein